MKKHDKYSAVIKITPAHFAVCKAIKVNRYEELKDFFLEFLLETGKAKIKIKKPYHFYIIFNNEQLPVAHNDAIMCVETEKSPRNNLCCFLPEKVLSVTHCGLYSEIDKAYMFLFDYAEQNHLKIIGQPSEHYLTILENNFSTDRLITEIRLPIG
jgi:effector-binding domain-containing protein